MVAVTCRRCSRLVEVGLRTCSTCLDRSRARFASESLAARYKRNEAKRALRARAKQRLEERFRPVTDDAEVLPDDDFEALERDFEAAKAIDQVVTRYKAGLSTTEIAAQLLLNAGRVWTLLKASRTALRPRAAATMIKWHRARRSLKDQIQAVFDTEADISKGSER